MLVLEKKRKKDLDMTILQKSTGDSALQKYFVLSINERALPGIIHASMVVRFVRKFKLLWLLIIYKLP